MTKSVAIVHDDAVFREAVQAALSAKGCNTIGYDSSLTALKEIEAGQGFDVVVTRIVFPPGQPNGASLALVLRATDKRLKFVFADRCEDEIYLEGIGELVPSPIDIGKLVEVVLK